MCRVMLKNSNTALMDAAASGNVNVVQIFISESSVDLDAVDKV